MQSGSGELRSRCGLTLIEVVTAAAIIAILLGILIPAMQLSREEARRTTCSDKLRVIGQAIGEYHEAHGSLPTIAARDGKVDIAVSPFHLIANSLEPSLQSNPSAAPGSHWSDSDPTIARVAVAQFLCPTSVHEPVVTSEAIARLKLPVGSEFGTTDYVLSKGPVDSWCVPEGPHKFGPIDDKQLGVYELNRKVKLDEITDGLSQTITIGEGSTGKRWILVNSKPFNPNAPNPLPDVLESSTYWICPRINTTRDRDTHHMVTASIYATTAVFMNEPLVSETLADIAALDDCRTSLKGGPHRIGGFRSDHEAGAMFLFADGSVHFLHQDLDPALYRAFSTIRGGESIYFGK